MALKNNYLLIFGSRIRYAIGGMQTRIVSISAVCMLVIVFAACGLFFTADQTNPSAVAEHARADVKSAPQSDQSSKPAFSGKDVAVREAPRRAGDPPRLVASSKKISDDLGWEPRFDGLDEIVETAWRFKQLHPRGYPRS